MKPKPSLSLYLAVLAWASVFALSWLLILRSIPADGLAFSFLAAFAIVAIFASSVASPKEK